MTCKNHLHENNEYYPSRNDVCSGFTLKGYISMPPAEQELLVLNEMDKPNQLINPYKGEGEKGFFPQKSLDWVKDAIRYQVCGLLQKFCGI